MLLELVPWVASSVSESPDTLYVPVASSVLDETATVQLQPPETVVQVSVTEKPASLSVAAAGWRAAWSSLQLSPMAQLEGITSVSVPDSVILTA
jgi:hypothetical protein